MNKKSLIPEVEIADKSIKLDKVIKVYLTTEDMTLDDLNKAKFSYKDLKDALIKKEEFIVTTQLECVSVLTMLQGYEILIVSDGNTIALSECYKNKLMRSTQNWRKMLLSGVFPIKVDF